MKRVWNEPEILVQQFVPNEYVAACGDSGVVYNFECNAGDKGLRDYPYNVYEESNGIPGLQTNRGGDTYISNFHACGDTHKAESDEIFLNGYIHDTRNNSVTNVIIWRESLGWGVYDTHCTIKLDMNSWTTSKS